MPPEYAVAQWVEQRRKPADGLQPSGRDTHFALALFGHVGRGLFERVSIFAVSDPVALHRDAHREDEIVEQRIVRHRYEQFAADREQLSGGSDGRIEAVVPLFELRFVLPVDTFGRCGRLFTALYDPLFACHAADLRIAEGPDDFADRFRAQHRVRIGENDQGCRDQWNSPVQCGCFAAPFGSKQHRDFRISGQQFVRAVVRTVRHPDDFQPAGRVVERPAVPHLVGDDRLFVVRGDKQCHFGQLFGQFDACSFAQRLFDPYQQVEENAVACISIKDDRQGNPKENLNGFHHAYV